MPYSFGILFVVGIFLVLLAGRMYFKKPSFTPAESCWHCLWRNFVENFKEWWPEFKWLHFIGYTAIGFVFGSWAALVLQRLWAYYLGRELIRILT